MREYLLYFFEEFEYPAEAVEQLLAAYDIFSQSCKAELDEMLAVYDADANCDYDALIQKMNELAKRCGVHVHTARLLLFICLSKKAKERYLEKGISEAIWKNSMMDLKYKLYQCKRVDNVWGSWSVWFPRFFIPNRFGLGRLQFETAEFRMDSYEKNGVSLKKGDTVLNVHIPAAGTGITREVIDESYAMAAKFYADEFKDRPVVFVCGSWLLYPGNDAFLPPHSNIRGFMSDYDILKVYEDPECKHAWLVFDTHSTDLDTYPQNSSLQRSLLAHMKAGGGMGSAYGVYVYNKK